MAKHDTPTETREQLLVRRMFKEIANSFFNDTKLSPCYCSVKISRSLGDDVASYVKRFNPEYFDSMEKLYKE